MTSDDLFARAEELKRQAAACEGVRAEVDAIWLGLDDVLDPVFAHHVPDVWQSMAADASRFRLHQQRSHLALARYDIQEIAGRLQARADELAADAFWVGMAAEAARRREAEELALSEVYFR